MKIRFRFLSIILVCVILLSAFPISRIVTAEDTKGDVLLNNFDDATNLSTIIDQDDLNRSVDASFDSSIKSSENGQSVKVTNKVSNSSKYNRARFKISNVTDSTITGFKVWIKNPSQNGISMAYQLINKSGSYIQMIPNRAYYTVNTLGEVSQHLMRKKVDGTNEGCIYIEPEFEGFVYLSVAHGFSSVTANNVSALVLSSYSKANELVSYYIDELSVYYNIPGENWSIRSFSEYETTDEMKNHMMYITNISSAVSLDTENDACVINTGSGTTNGNISFQFSGEPAFNNHTGMKVRMKTSSAADTDMLFKWEATAHRMLKSNATYYLVDAQGNIYSKKTFTRSGENLITIPASFDGWLYVPFSSAENMTYSDIFRVYLNVKMENLLGKELSVYNISLYKELPVKEGASFIINDFEDYETTQNLKDALANGNRNILDIELDKNAWETQGLKITQIDDEKGASIAVNFGVSDIAKNFDGFKIRIKVNKNADMLIKSEDDQHRPMKAKAVYYLVSSDGRAYSYTASNDSASLVQFTAGFDGWIYIPFNSLTQIDLTKMYRIWFGPELTNEIGTEFVIDDIVFYKGTPQVINDTPIEFKRVLPNKPIDYILDFDDCTSTEEMKNKIKVNKATDVEEALDSTVAQNNNSCKFTFSDDGGEVATIVEFAKNAYFSEITGFRFWIKASEATESVSLLYKLETNEHRPIKNSAIYYRADKNGKVSKQKASASNEAALIYIPAGYEGWIYVPFSSIYPMNIEDLYRIWFSFSASKDASKNIWLDSIGCYTDNPIPSNLDVINDFEDYETTQNLKDSLVNGNVNILDIQLDKNAWGSKGLKITQTNTEKGASVAVNFEKSDNSKNYNGFKIRIKVNKDSDMLIKSEDDQHRPMKAKALYYLVYSDGRAYSYSASNDSASLVQFDAGFDGWIYIPFTSLTQIDLTKMYRIWFGPELTNEIGTEFIIDDIKFYKDEPQVINDTPIKFKRILPNKPIDYILDFDDCTSTEEMTKKIMIHRVDNVQAELDSTVAQNMNSCKFTFAEKGGKVSTIVEFAKNAYFAEITGFRFWVKASEANESATLEYKLETNEHRPVKRSAVYYLADKNGKVSSRKASASSEAALISIPAGYEGWIYIPFSSIYPMSIEDLYRIWFSFSASKDASKNIWLDSIGCYTDNPITTDTHIINDFDYYSGTADILIDSAFESRAESGNFSIDSTYRDGDVGKSLKIKTIGGGYKFIFSPEGRSEYDGFVFYVKNTSKQVVRLLPQTDTTGRDSFIPNRAYFIENLSTGSVEMKKFEKVIADAGNMEIPAGFEGYVYLPYSSAYPSLLRNIEKLNSFWLTIPPQIASEAEVYVDTLAFYKNETCRIKDILVWKQDTPGMLYGFEKSESVTGYRGWISSDERLDVSINKGKAKSGINSLKISTPIKTTDGVKNDWAITSLSLKNEDGTATDVSKYDGIALWLKVERDGTDTKPVSDEVNFGFKVNMPAHGRLYSTSPIYVLSDDSDKTNPVVYTNTPDGCTAVNLKAGFSGMIYIPFSEIKAFSSKEELSTTTLTDIFLMFRFHNLIGYNVYIDDIHGFNMVDLKNVQWPGDHDYNALTDTMYFISTEKYNAPESNAAGLDKNVVNNLDGENNIVLPIVLGSAAVIICVIGFVTFVVIKKKQKKQIPIKANK